MNKLENLIHLMNNLLSLQNMMNSLLRNNSKKLDKTSMKISPSRDLMNSPLNLSIINLMNNQSKEKIMKIKSKKMNSFQNLLNIILLMNSLLDLQSKITLMISLLNLEDCSLLMI